MIKVIIWEDPMNNLKILFRLFLVFFKIGSVTFGGGLAMLPLIHREVVERQKWVNEREIVDIFAITQSVPGVIAVNSAIFIGNKVKGLSGALVAVVGVILPAFGSILLILMALVSLQHNIYVEKFLAGIKAAATGLILLSALSLGRSVFKNKSKKGYAIAIGSFLAIAFINVNAAWTIIGGGMVGLVSCFFHRENE